jgi:hypothetical protein
LTRVIPLSAGRGGWDGGFPHTPFVGE